MLSISHIDEYAVKIVNKAKEDNRKVCAIGTTTVRAVESSVTAQNLLKAAEGWTNTFIHPPYDFSIPNALVTNFHLPKTSTPDHGMRTFAGYDSLVMEAYQQAIKEKYRFFSYGDAMLIAIMYKELLERSVSYHARQDYSSKAIYGIA